MPGGGRARHTYRCMRAAQSRTTGALHEAVRAIATHLPVESVEVVEGKAFTPAEAEAVRHALATAARDEEARGA